MPEIRWKDAPEEHDYPAALDYLELHTTPPVARTIVSGLKAAPTVSKKAKDIIRASGLPLLRRDNTHVEKDLRKIQAGEHLSPVLLVRGNLATGQPLVIADGYHRVCAAWHMDEDAEIACRLA